MAMASAPIGFNATSYRDRRLRRFGCRSRPDRRSRSEGPEEVVDQDSCMAPHSAVRTQRRILLPPGHDPPVCRLGVPWRGTSLRTQTRE